MSGVHCLRLVLQNYEAEEKRALKLWNDKWETQVAPYIAQCEQVSDLTDLGGETRVVLRVLNQAQIRLFLVLGHLHLYFNGRAAGNGKTNNRGLLGAR